MKLLLGVATINFEGCYYSGCSFYSTNIEHGIVIVSHSLLWSLIWWWKWMILWTTSHFNGSSTKMPLWATAELVRPNQHISNGFLILLMKMTLVSYYQYITWLLNIPIVSLLLQIPLHWVHSNVFHTIWCQSKERRQKRKLPHTVLYQTYSWKLQYVSPS